MAEHRSDPRRARTGAEGQTGQGDHPQDTAHLRPVPVPPTGAVQYRVSWRRYGWQPATSDGVRLYERRHAAERFVTRLAGDLHPLLTDLEYVRVEIRDVGPWREVQL